MAKLLRTAIRNQRWDLAAHALVLAAVQTHIKQRDHGVTRKRRTAAPPKRR